MNKTTKKVSNKKTQPGKFSKLEESLLREQTPTNYITRLKAKFSTIKNGRKSFLTKEWLKRHVKYQLSDIEKARKELAKKAKRTKPMKKKTV